MTVEWVKLKLALADFDERAIADRAAQTDLSGIALRSLDSMAWAATEHRKLYDLNRECSRDIPERGDFYSFPEYVEQRIKGRSFDPRCVVVAIHGREWIGMTAASNHLDEGFMFDEMTGVRSAYRRRGLSLSLKLANIRRMRDLGATVIHTMHNVQNTAAIEMNRKLGYVPR